MQLQKNLYSQLQNEKIPEKATDTIGNQLRELRKVAAKRLILVVLDGVFVYLSKLCSQFSISSDMWDAEHERPFSCIDPDTASKLLVVRRSDGSLIFCCVEWLLDADDSHQGHHAEGT